MYSSVIVTSLQILIGSRTWQLKASINKNELVVEVDFGDRQLEYHEERELEIML